ncbi:hypothetical protein DEO72_LG1g2915 [Vigna unguiculata]|uniref:Uncharacterized protein n=1 Tax=Vigna unguiculata TaxID=3917 RepID=A0A4D6KMH2_VIGUN|nr:hypothetical protein DEO72_LG1g2915 [Vigna unguiculata]
MPPSDRTSERGPYTAWRLTTMCAPLGDSPKIVGDSVVVLARVCCLYTLMRTLIWRCCAKSGEVGSYVPCSHLRDAACGELRSWWIRVLDYGRVEKPWGIKVLAKN